MQLIPSVLDAAIYPLYVGGEVFTHPDLPGNDLQLMAFGELAHRGMKIQEQNINCRL